MKTALHGIDDFIFSFYEITSSAGDFHNKVRSLLQLGMRRFRLSTGILSNIVGEEYRVVAVESQGDSFKVGDRFELGQMYCAETVKLSASLGFSHAKNTRWQKHPCYKSLGLESYLGMPVTVVGELYGTLNFSSRHPRTSRFNKADKTMIQLMASWMEGELERLEMGKRLNEYAEQTKLETSRSSTFLSLIGREIHPPLNTILKMNERMLGTDLTHEQHELVRGIESSARKLFAVSNEMLDFSRVESGNLTLQPIPFKPADLVSETIHFFHPRVCEKNINLSVLMTSAVPETLVGDVARIRQVLEHLVDNALKFSHRDGVVFVNLSGVQSEAENFQITFTVQDNGMGIPDPIREKIFEPFLEAEDSHGGTGLGLTLCKRLVGLMDGKIGFDSIEGTGTTFWFTLPLKMDTHVKSPGGNDRGNGGQRKHRDYSDRKPVLVVEDTLVNRELFTMQLCEFGLSTHLASNGREALELLQVEPDAYSLVLMDLDMPEMDGITAVRLIRKNEEKSSKHSLIIAITANSTTGVQEACLSAGMDDFISKPVSLKDIETLLAKWLADKP